MKIKIIDDLAILLDNIISEKQLSKLQEFLLSGAIFTDASKVLAILIIFILVAEIVLALTLTLLKLPVSVLILPLFVIPHFSHMLLSSRKNERRKLKRLHRTS